MKAYITTQFGPPEVLKLQEVDKPSPKAGEVFRRRGHWRMQYSKC